MSEELPYQSIKSWAEDERPREKLLLKGRAALSDAELIAILIGSGSRNESAVDLSKRILSASNANLNELAKLSVADLMQFKGIGEAKAISIITALELGKRRRLSEVLQKPKITCSNDVYDLLQPHIADLSHEEFWVLFLNQRNMVISSKCMGQGGITGTISDVRLIFREALMQKATAIVAGHNHPSGNTKPSQQDIHLTKRLKESGALLEIRLLDHIIVTQKHYYSFADEGMM